MNKLWCGILGFLLFTTAALGGNTGKIAGKITDAQTKETLVGVNVVLVGKTLGAASDVDGNYFIINIPPGTYHLRASAIGYSSSLIDSIQVYADQTTRIDIVLGQQSVEVTGVEITATRPIVQKDLTSTTASITSEQIDRTPVEDVQSVVNLQAGVTDGHFRGGRTGEVKYLVDGISVNDAFSGDNTLQPELNSIQEIQVLSGTFNAEYGEALSGVVNQITKIPEDHYEGSVSAYTGDYVTTNTALYPNISHISPSDLENVEGSLSGPVPTIGNLLRFFVSGRYLYDAGYLYGKREFNTTDSSNFSANNPSQWYIQHTGDGAYVSMNPNTRYTLQGKISLNLGGATELIFSGMTQEHDYRNFDFMFQLDPDGDYYYHQRSSLGGVTFNDAFSASTFLNLNANIFKTQYSQYVYADPNDPRWVNPDLLLDVGADAFYVGGVENWNFFHTTTTSSVKADLTSQVSQIHQIKTGIEVKWNTLDYLDYQVHDDATSNFMPELPAPTAFDYNAYTNHPFQFAAYIQDKIELDYLIINAGLRYDYFQPDGQVLKDPNNIGELDTLSPPFPSQFFNKATAKMQWSPRLGISYPMSDRGAVHISYGHFFQMPPFEDLYLNPNFRVPLSSGYPNNIGSIIGNADLQPQRTTMYEIGLQQEVAPNIGVTLTGYSKDIRNLLGVQLYLKDNEKQFAQYINTDFGEVKGITVSVEKRLTDGFGGNLDYTYQTAQGTASDPNQDLINAQQSPPVESNKELVPLSWDRTHSLNCTVTYGKSGGFIATAIMQLGSGLPYTPSFQNQRTGLENSANMPPDFTTNIFLSQPVNLFNRVVSIFLKVYNLFDDENDLNVYGDTGSPAYTLQETQQPPVVRGVNTITQYFTRPDFYSSPRQIVIGASTSF
jgi:outer membrane receptor protein involved in Fe transport